MKALVFLWFVVFVPVLGHAEIIEGLLPNKDGFTVTVRAQGQGALRITIRSTEPVDNEALYLANGSDGALLKRPSLTQGVAAWYVPGEVQENASEIRFALFGDRQSPSFVKARRVESTRTVPGYKTTFRVQLSNIFTPLQMWRFEDGGLTFKIIMEGDGETYEKIFRRTGTTRSFSVADFCQAPLVTADL